MLIVFWFILSIVCGVLGSERNIGGVPAFFLSLLLSPLIGFIVVFASERKKPFIPQSSKWEELVQLAEIEKYKGNNAQAIDKYKEAQYWLEKQINELKDKSLILKYRDRLDGLKMIVKKLESGDITQVEAISKKQNFTSQSGEPEVKAMNIWIVLFWIVVAIIIIVFINQ